MSAHIVRGVLITVGIIAALGLAVYENPEVQGWLDDQRRKLAVLLRSIGDELDPQSRQEAEAFAFGAAPQARGTATASGVQTTSDATTIRRVPMQGSVSDEDREARQRLGQQYLARRNQQMMEMQQRRRVSRATSFDEMVDAEGLLKAEDVKQEDVKQEGESSISPFADVNEIERSETPRPAVPPKIKLETIDPRPIPDEDRTTSMPGALPVDEIDPTVRSVSELSYEDQLAIALMTSTEPQPSDYDEQIRRAIRLSLQEPDITMEDPDISVPPSEADTDELYHATPDLTRARLAALDVQHPALVPEPQGQRTPTEASSFAFRSDTMSERSRSMSEAIEVTDAASEASEEGMRTPDSWTEIGSHDADEMHAV